MATRGTETTMTTSTTTTAPMGVAELFSVAGKVAVVTGGSRGVGRMIAHGFVEAGARVYIAARTAEVCDQTAAELSALPGEGACISVPADLSTEEGCRALAEAVAAREDELHILVNNAGVPGPMSTKRHDDAGWQDVLAVNLLGVYHLTQQLLPQLKKASRPDDPARVINIGSLTGLSAPDVDSYAYAASKAGMHHLTAHLAKRLAPRVTVNAMVLGPFESKMTEKAIALFRERIAAAAPLNRIGRPDDLAGTARFLSSRAGAYLTGVLIPVDGGMATAT
jgi:NAD(P)-dependent dehydrogenase (short-subunit alcohol dehydrogenase family)